MASLENVKGRIAEMAVEAIFMASGHTIYQTGIEYRMPSLFHCEVKPKKNFYDKTTDKLCDIPDFALPGFNGELEYIEVKFRQYGNFYKEDKPLLEKLAKFWEPTIIIVSLKNGQAHFTKVEPPYIKDGSCAPLNGISIFEVVRWALDPLLLPYCTKFVEMLNEIK